MTARSPSPRVDVAITGLGVVSAAGIDTAATWTRVLAGRPTARVCPLCTGFPPTWHARSRTWTPRPGWARTSPAEPTASANSP